MRINISVNTKGQIYIPTKIREAIGLKLKGKNKLSLIANAQSFFLIPAELSSEDALDSLNVIAEHLKHSIRREQK